MATLASSQPRRQQAAAGAYDRMFYSGMAMVMAATVFIGFARTYYLSAYFGTHGTIGGRPFSTLLRHLSAGATPEKGDDLREHETEDSEAVVSDLKGHVVLDDGAKFSKLLFSVPGALAQVEGTYSLLTERIDFRGTLKTLSQPSKSTHGIKSVWHRICKASVPCLFFLHSF